MAETEKCESITQEYLKEDTKAEGHGENFNMPECLRGLSPEEYKKVGRSSVFKENIIILPCLMLMYILNYLYRNNIASAKLAHITDDLQLTDTQYQSCVSILFARYIIMQIPSDIIVGKLKKPSCYICGVMCVWGIISAAQTSANSYVNLIIAPVFYPGALFYLSLFYNRKQYAFRASMFYVGSQLGNALGELLAIPILDRNGRYGLAGWRWLLIEGVATIGMSAIFYFVLPNSINDIKFLTDFEREWIRFTAAGTLVAVSILGCAVISKAKDRATTAMKSHRFRA